MNKALGAVLTVLVGLVGWALLTVQSTSVDVGRISEKLDNVVERVERVTADRYTKNEAERDLNYITYRLEQLEHGKTRKKSQ